MAARKVRVRVNASHDGLRAGQEYELAETADVKERAEGKLLTILGPVRRAKPKPKDEPEDADG
jgi:hypothetical protein